MLQVTAVFVAPVTVAEKVCGAPCLSVGDAGVTFTLTTGAVVTVTVAVADFVESAVLVATT
jgi:hypothetical protein